MYLQQKRKDAKHFNRGGTWTRSLRLRRPTPYPLGHTTLRYHAREKLAAFNAKDILIVASLPYLTSTNGYLFQFQAPMVTFTLAGTTVILTTLFLFTFESRVDKFAFFNRTVCGARIEWLMLVTMHWSRCEQKHGKIINS